MARKPSPSNRGNRASAARRANDTNRGEAGRTRGSSSEQSRSQKRGSTTGRSGRAKRSDEQVWTPDQQAATRGRSDRSPGQRGGPGSRLAGQRDSDADLEKLRTRGRNDAVSGGGATETGAERQGMGRGHRRNFDKSDDDAITRGQSRDDESSTAPDSGVNRRSRAMDDSMTHGRSSSRDGRSGRRSDW